MTSKPGLHNNGQAVASRPNSSERNRRQAQATSTPNLAEEEERVTPHPQAAEAESARDQGEKAGSVPGVAVTDVADLHVLSPVRADEVVGGGPVHHGARHGLRRRAGPTPAGGRRPLGGLGSEASSSRGPPLLVVIRNHHHHHRTRLAAFLSWWAAIAFLYFGSPNLIYLFLGAELAVQCTCARGTCELERPDQSRATTAMAMPVDAVPVITLLHYTWKKKYWQLGGFICQRVCLFSRQPELARSPTLALFSPNNTIHY